MNTGEIIRRERKTRGMTQKTLSSKMGKDGTYVNAYETNRRTPTLKVLCQFADAFGISVQELLRDYEGGKDA